MRTNRISEEVLVAADPLVQLTRVDAERLIASAGETARQRIRLCAHKSSDDRLHEMFIVHPRGAYVRPHRHRNKSESMLIVQGTVDFLMLDDDGRLTDVIQMGEYGSGRTFYYRSDTPIYHTLLITSDVLLFLEITNGPFDRADTIFAPWSPDGSNETAVRQYMEALADAAKKFQPGADGLTG
jgi:cupin fold WbuC family metalloprotein